MLFDDDEQRRQEAEERQDLHRRVESALLSMVPDLTTAIVDHLLNQNRVHTFDRQRYSRRPAGRTPSRQAIEKYSREAADSAARKNHAKPGSTTFEKEFAEVCRRNGVAA